MTEQTSITRSVVVEAPLDKAFSIFTERIGDIKPPEHNLLGAPIVTTTLEPHVGGNIVDRDDHGNECRWATILAFDPPGRLVFSWNISPQWEILTDPAVASEVEVRFTAESPSRTRVELEHRHLDRHGPGWQAMGDDAAGSGGWPLYLSRFAALTA
jgi:uncharacterized protein YndB with AHSA1/START domain